MERYFIKAHGERWYVYDNILPAAATWVAVCHQKEMAEKICGLLNSNPT